MDLTVEFKNKVVKAMLDARSMFGGADNAYAVSLGIPASSYSQLKKGKTDGLLSNTNWITLARNLQVSNRDHVWNTARTAVYENIEENLHFCKEYSKAMMLVDDCGIGKTHSAKHIIKNMANTFYVDCSQASSKLQFIRLLAKTVGLESHGRAADVKANLKYYLATLDRPLIVLDEAGDLEYPAFLVLKELWNGTDGACGWYMMGADGLRNKIEQGISQRKVGFAEIFSRFSDEFVKLTPTDKDQRRAFLSDLVRQVAEANSKDRELVPRLVRKCMEKDSTLRYLDTLIKMTA